MYALEGEVVSKVGDEPEKTYATGEMWMETPGQLHAVSALGLGGYHMGAPKEESDSIPALNCS